MGTKMFKLLSLATLFLATVSNAAPAANACGNNLYVIAARGTDQAPGTGSIGEVADQMKKYAPHLHILAVQYPATEKNYPDYLVSLKAGTLRTQAMIRNIVNRCPNAKIAVLGYSQGANVVADALAGSTENKNGVAPLNTKYARNIKAVVLAGDPTHNHRQKFTVGSGHNDGSSARQEGWAMHPYANRIVSYCNARDPICNKGSDMDAHHTYMAKYKVNAAYFALSKLWE